ncbi:hypothetical protein RRG08_004201, partial [Elysia crispata]
DPHRDNVLHAQTDRQTDKECRYPHHGHSSPMLTHIVTMYSTHRQTTPKQRAQYWTPMRTVVLHTATTAWVPNRLRAKIAL